MYAKSKALASYGRVASAESNPLQQIVMLYDGAMKFLHAAAADIEAKDIPAKAEHTGRALDIIGYLQSILDFERGGDAAPALDRLYSQVTAVVLRASASLDAAQMRHAAALLAPVRDAWATNATANAVPAATNAPVATATAAAPTTHPNPFRWGSPA